MYYQYKCVGCGVRHDKEDLKEGKCPLCTVLTDVRKIIGITHIHTSQDVERIIKKRKVDW